VEKSLYVVLKGRPDKESSVAVDHGRMVKGLFGDRFYCENGLLSVLKIKGRKRAICMGKGTEPLHPNRP